MKNYKCIWGLYHDKPSTGQPSSNNGWIYTAYANKLGLEIDWDRITETFHRCYFFREDGFYLIRLPNKFTPPMSRDEVIGLASLFEGFAKELIAVDYYYLGVKPKNLPSLKEQLKAVYSLKGKHRNYVWEQELYAAYSIVFRLWWNDRYYLKKLSNMKPSLFETIMFYLNAVHTILYGSESVKNILWLQLEDLGSKFLKKRIKRKENFEKYFGSEHVFNQKNE